MKFGLEFTRQYLKDLRLARKRGLDETKLNSIILNLVNGEALPPKCRDHALVGNYKGFRECHVSPDWLLIYRLDDSVKIVTLVRTGTQF